MDNNEENNRVQTAKETADVGGLIWKHRKVVGPAAGCIMSILGTILIFALIAALFNSIGTAFAETIYNGITGVVNGFKSALGDIGDTWDMYTTENEKQKMIRAEEAYYKKLQQVYNQFKKDYEVEIDTTMITSTLLFGRSEELTSDEKNNTDLKDLVDSDGNTTAVEGTKSWYEKQKNIYKKAKANITRLAYYQIVVTVTVNDCVPEEKVYSGTKPETDKEIAENWEHPYKYDSHFVNIRTNYNYISANTIDETNKLGICPYHDAEPTLHMMFEEDKLTYEAAEQAYQAAYDDMIADYEYCLSQHKNDGYICDYDEVGDLANERAARDRAQAAYMWWVHVGMFDMDGGNFNCITTDRFGTLDRYSNAKDFRNYDIDTNVLSPTVGSFVQSLEYFDRIGNKCNGSTCRDTNCSQKPAMNVQYTVELAREGVYYWRLLSYNEKAIIEENKNSFIKSYYFKDIDVKPEDEIEQLELIYDNYQTWSDRTLTKGFNSFICLDYASDGSGSTGAGDPTTWKQTDSRWSGVALGNETLGSVGCFVTSWTIQLALSFQANPEALLAATGCASIDPGSIATYLAANGAFTSGGALKTLESLYALFPGIQFNRTSISGNMEQKAATFQKMLDAGQKPIVRVKYGDTDGDGDEDEHWVAVTGVDASGNITIADPGYNKTSLSEWAQTAGVTLDVRYVTTG